MPPVTISAEALACQRGERLLFKGLSFTAGPGLSEIAGPNGSGKSSLLRILAGLLRPLSGRLSFHIGAVAAGDDEDVSRLLHLVGHGDGLKAQLTAQETLAFSAAWGGARYAPAEALSRLGLARQAALPCGVLSAGQRRRLALARCWMLDRPVWLLDEPTAALDEAGRALALALMAAHAEAGGTVIAATHEPLGGAQRIVVA